MSELNSLGLGPSVLRSLQQLGDLPHSEEQDDSESGKTLTVDSETPSHASHRHMIVYEIISNSSVPELRLRVSSSYASNTGTHHDAIPSTEQSIYHVDLLIPTHLLGHITRALPHPPTIIGDEVHNSTESYALFMFRLHYR